MKTFCKLVLTLILSVSPLSAAGAGQPGNGARDLLQAGLPVQAGTGSYGCSAQDIAHYVARRAAGRSLPPRDGDVWRIFFGRFELLRPGGVELNPHPAWVMSRHAVYDTHIPECFPYIQMSNKTVGQ